ncbi:MAG: DUF1801 domain-containing protein [Leptospira sp.]|nr:DUF1801 domain-containing protein [Leptospira sp.]
MKLKFQNPEVAEVFFKYQGTVREKLLELRALIFQIAEKHKEIGPLEETLKWGEPSYLTTQSKSGSTIRIHHVKNNPNEYAIFFNCKTTLVDSFKEKYEYKFKFGGNRAIYFDINKSLPNKELMDCIYLALTYNLKNKKAKN